MTKIISLIANSGIQFIEGRANLDENSESFNQRSRFAEIVHETKPGVKEYELVFPYRFEKMEKEIIRDSINEDAFDPKTGKIIEDNIREEHVRYIDELKGDKIYSVQARESIETFEETWLPIPYFRKKRKNMVEFGPFAWARMLFSKIPGSDRSNDGATHYITIAFDTQTSENPENDLSKVPASERNSAPRQEYIYPKDLDASQGSIFVCSANEDANFNFAALNWVDEWIEKEFEERKLQDSKYKFKYIALYFNLIKVLNAAKAFPEVSFHSSDQLGSDISNEVDLILDIGNSRTCGLLYETSRINKPFKFTDAVPLRIRNLTYPNRTYSDPFTMQLAFVKAIFGKSYPIIHRKRDDELFEISSFKWLSVLRVGEEARMLSVVNNKISANFSMSSPKRYLWDDQRSVFQWEFVTQKKDDIINVEANKVATAEINNYFTSTGVYYQKALQQAKLKGENEPTRALSSNYSRKSLMTFIFVEIFLQALTQINSFEFRIKHGDEKIPRKLKRVVLTCPTAMVQEERFFLRDLALDAIKAVSEIFGKNFVNMDDVEIVPNPRAIKMLADQELDPDEQKNIKDWAYDEATCSQLTFLYGEIVHRYSRKTAKFFEITGKKRKKSLYPDKPSVTIASVDIGGGTTDLMIATYQTTPSDQTVIIPDPEFWEGFNLAGDDISRRIIETLILPAIADEAKHQHCKDVVDAMSFLFGHDMQRQMEEDRHFRKQFVSQIALPIAYQFIQHAVEERENARIGFKDFFISYPNPNDIIIEFINKNFVNRGAVGFDIRNVTWTISTVAINEVVKRVMNKMLKKLSVVIAQYNCDYLLLAGRPTTMPVIRNILLKYLPTFTDRVIQLGNYRIGRWYPFADAAGRIKDPKTCVAVGATISMMSKLGRIEGFRLETKYLKEKQKSTAEYLGKYELDSSQISKIFFTPKNDFYTLEFNSPMIIGMKQIEIEDWIGTPIYKLDFANPQIAARLSSRMPLKVDIQRVYSENKEKISRIESITDREGDEIAINSLILKLQTLPDEYGYWMDTGNLNLPIF